MRKSKSLSLRETADSTKRESAPPAGQPPLAGGIGAADGTICGPFGCESPQFQNFQAEPAKMVFDLFKEFLKECIKDPHGCERLYEYAKEGFKWGYSAAKRAPSRIKNGVITEANKSFGCIDAPCIQRALENIRQQQLNGTWEKGSPPVVITTKPTVVPVKPDPNSWP